jgi:hypothetical protein
MVAAGARPGFAPGSFDRRGNASSTCAGRAALALVSGADSGATVDVGMSLTSPPNGPELCRAGTFFLRGSFGVRNRH